MTAFLCCVSGQVCIRTVSCRTVLYCSVGWASSDRPRWAAPPSHGPASFGPRFGEAVMPSHWGRRGQHWPAIGSRTLIEIC